MDRKHYNSKEIASKQRQVEVLQSRGTELGVRKIHKHIQLICVITLFISAVASSDVFAQQRPTGVMCDGYARNYAEQATAGKMAGKMFVDTLVGLGIGAATGGAGLGAAIGLGVGTLGGGVIKSREYEKAYRIAYQDCITGRVK